MLRVLIGLVLLGLCGTSTSAQPAKPLPLIGWLRVASPDLPPGKFLSEALANRGLVEGRHYRLVVYSAEGDLSRFPALAAQLVGESPAIIVAFGPDATRYARAATSTIPIVSASAFVEEGLVKSLAQPKGNLTGVSLLVDEIDPKRLEILKELMGKLRTVAVLNDKSTHIPNRAATMAAGAARLGFELAIVDVKQSEDFEAAFEDFLKRGAQALTVNSSTLFATLRDRIGALSKAYRLPAICQWRSMVESGCLASYGFPLTELFELVAEQVDKVWRGAKPEMLPVLQPRRFELVINLRVAREMGVEVPAAMLARADEVIE